MNKTKSILMTPDPYHVPGYGGYCPQVKYRIGETFGRTTNRLFADNNVSSSGRLVLADLHSGETTQDPRVLTLEERKHSWGDQKLCTKMVPGYTGFIPKSQHYFGKRYAENCLSSIADFENFHQKHIKNNDRLRVSKPPSVKSPESGTSADVKVPMKPIAKYPRPFISTKAFTHSMSPYYMNNSDTDKRFVSGYTGFVPRARGLLGAGYPHITHVALNEFTDDIKRFKDLARRPISIHRKKVASASPKIIYPQEMGLVPRYTGHIPGERFRFGNTFGHSTKDALKTTSDGVQC